MESTGVSSAATSQKKYQVHTEEVHKLHRERQKKEMAVVKGGKLLCFYVKGVMLFIFLLRLCFEAKCDTMISSEET